MELSIVEGRWYVESDDLWLRIVIQPRRSLEGSATRLTLRAEPMPLLELLPENIEGTTPAAAWVWDGTPNNAKAIALSVLDVLRSHLASDNARSAKTREWRRKVLAVLGERTASSRPVPQTQRA